MKFKEKSNGNDQDVSDKAKTCPECGCTIAPFCPKCGSTDLTKISTASKVASVALLGVLAANKDQKHISMQ